MTPAQLAALKTEIQTDPATLGYTGKTHEQISALLTTPNRQANRETLDAGLLVAAIVRAEYDVLLAPAKDYLRLIAMVGTLPLTANLKTELQGIFAAGSATRANLVALLKRPGTRCEELDLPNATTSDVADALR